MIDYKVVKVGDICKVVGNGAPGHYELGELVRVTKVESEGVYTENQKGVVVNFVFNCGAARLEPTEDKGDFDIK